MGVSQTASEQEERLRTKYLEELTDMAKRANLPIVKYAEASGDPKGVYEAMGARLRALTLRQKAKSWKRFIRWLSATFQLNHPTEPKRIILYLAEAVAAHCPRSTLKAFWSTLKFMETRGGVSEDKYIHEW